jgi:hypothetical protein
MIRSRFIVAQLIFGFLVIVMGISLTLAEPYIAAEAYAAALADVADKEIVEHKVQSHLRSLRLNRMIPSLATGTIIIALSLLALYDKDRLLQLTAPR